jgi:hypothetical protein
MCSFFGEDKGTKKKELRNKAESKKALRHHFPFNNTHSIFVSLPVFTYYYMIHKIELGTITLMRIFCVYFLLLLTTLSLFTTSLCTLCWRSILWSFDFFLLLLLFQPRQAHVRERNREC